MYTRSDLHTFLIHFLIKLLDWVIIHQRMLSAGGELLTFHLYWGHNHSLQIMQYEL